MTLARTTALIRAGKATSVTQTELLELCDAAERGEAMPAAPAPRRYERTWFRMNAHPQESAPETFLAYDFADAVAQSEREAAKCSGDGCPRLWSVRPVSP